MSIRVVQCAGDGQYAIATAQIGHPRCTQVFWQMREEGASADVQAFPAEHVGMVEQFNGWLIQVITRRIRRYEKGLGLHLRAQQARFFYRQRCLNRTDVTLQKIPRSTWQVFDHGTSDHRGAGHQLTL